MIPSPDTNQVLLLLGVVYALSQVLGKVMDWKIGERRRRTATNGDADRHDVDLRLENVESNTRAMRVTMNEIGNAQNTLLSRLTDLITVLEDDAKHMRGSLHAIRNDLNVTLGRLPELLALAIRRAQDRE